jgi:glycyl-tRNA synthetase beta chain
VVFHNLMGTSWEKVERFKALALHLADRVGFSFKSKLERAAELSKCDLVTGVVQEFPTLQGLMGREYALRDGEDPEVAEAIFEHYLPNRAGGGLPASSPGAILSVADKLDTICGCFAVGLTPTGAADPFALRRGALGIINIFLDRGWTGLESLMDRSLELLAPWAKRPARETKAAVLDFFRVRLKGLMTGRGLSADTAEAVLVLHGHEPLAAFSRALALESLKTREGFKDLVQVFKRVVNIIKKFGAHEDFTDWSRLSQEAEKTLLSRVEKLEQKSAGLIADGYFDGLVNDIADLRGPVDHFFERVLVDDPDPQVKEARIALLSRLGRLFEEVADFSRLNTA